MKNGYKTFHVTVDVQNREEPQKRRKKNAQQYQGRFKLPAVIYGAFFVLSQMRVNKKKCYCIYTHDSRQVIIAIEII